MELIIGLILVLILIACVFLLNFNSSYWQRQAKYYQQRAYTAESKYQLLQHAIDNPVAPR